MSSDEKLMDKAEEIVRGMLMGFSVAVHGCGSKIKVIDCVLNILRVAGVKIVRLRGYDQTCPLVRSFSSGIMGTSKRSTIRTQSDVLKAIERSNAKIFVLVDSIDGSVLRAHQEFLSEVASKPNVHLCASVDHSKVGLLWSPPQTRRFRWIWMEANTYLPYTQEVKDLVPFWRDLIEGRTDAAALSLKTLGSFTDKHRELVKLMAKMQLDMLQVATKKSKTGDDENQDPKTAGQIRSLELLKWSKKLMIADSLPKLKNILQELLDHRLVMDAKERETGNELFWLPFDRQRLENVAEGNFK